jgi:methionine-rich copper-binding protein CopC
VGWLAMLPAAAFAHAILLSSQPASGATVEAGAVELQFRFNSRIDHARSRLTLIRPDRTRAVLPISPDSPPDIMKASAQFTPGAYVLRWQVLAVDGHITRGDVPFGVSGR